jgi:hypothetical protein
MRDYNSKDVISEVKNVLGFITFVNTALVTVNTLFVNLNEFVQQGSSFITIFAPIFYAVGRIEFFGLAIFVLCMSPIFLLGLYDYFNFSEYSDESISTLSSPTKTYIFLSAVISLIFSFLLIFNEHIASELASNIFNLFGLRQVGDVTEFKSDIFNLLGGITFLYCGYLSYQIYRNGVSNDLLADSNYIKSPYAKRTKER